MQYAASFHCFVVEWQDCQEFQPFPGQKCTFVDRTVGAEKHRAEYVCGFEQTLLHQVWKKKQKEKRSGTREGPSGKKKIPDIN